MDLIGLTSYRVCSSVYAQHQNEDIHTSAAEMVYDTPLTVPGDFVCPSDDPVAADQLLSNLRDEVLKLLPTPVLRHGTAVSRVPNNIMSTDYVFVRHDAHRGLLHRIYDGPYRGIERADKTFDAELGLEGHVMFRKDRMGKRGGGVLLYIKEAIPAYEVHTVKKIRYFNVNLPYFLRFLSVACHFFFFFFRYCEHSNLSIIHRVIFRVVLL